MRLRAFPLLAFAVFATACIKGLETPEGRFGAISVPAWDNDAAGYVMAPEAAFYGKTDLTFAPFTTDTCLVAGYSPTASVTPGLVTLNAGNFLFTQIGTRTDTLAPIPNINIRVYVPLRSTGIPFIPGDTLSITIPGTTSWPASAISVRTAEPFTHDTILVPAADSSLHVTWTAATVPGSLMTFSLRYANAFSNTGLNEQVFCSFIDDGSATIATDYLNGWRTALGDERATRVVRTRWKEVILDDHTRISMTSSFARPLLPFIP